MKKPLHLLLLFFASVNGSILHAQQDINFSQFYEMPLLRNPALAGVFNGNVRFTAAYRNQWQSVTVPYRTMALGTEMKIFKGLSQGDFMTLGFQLTNDQAGDSKLKRAQFLPVLNYNKLLNDNSSTYISLAFTGGMVNESFDPSKLQFNDQFVNGSYSSSNPTSQTFNRTSFSYWDASTGLSFSTLINNNLKFYMGAGLFHFTRPRLTFMHDNEVRLNRKWVVNAGISTYTNDVDKLELYADYFIQGGNRLLQSGVLFTHNFDNEGDDSRTALSLGTAYRLKDALIPVVKLKTGKMSIGFSYDVNISKLTQASSFRGGYELTLTYRDLWNKDNIEVSKLRCPVNFW